MPEFTLYNLKDDPAQLNNLAKEDSVLLNEMKDEFMEITKGFYRPFVAEVPLK